MVLGSNSEGALGDGTQVNRATPVQMLGVDDATGLAVAEDRTCVLRQGGEMLCTGRNDHGQLGLGHRVTQRRLTRVPQLAPGHLMGSGHGRSNLVVTTNNDLIAWGLNDQGNLGLGHLQTPVLEKVGVPGF